MSNDNMKYWSQVSQPPADALKTIRGGRLSGMTDINPQWRYQVMTETFGPIGFGWKYEIVNTWIEPGPDGQVSQFAQVNLYVKGSQEWSAPIPGIGGSAFVAKESKGLYMSDEAIKMAVTDALGVAMKMLGVAADIYAGKWDGSKYASPAAPKEENGRKTFTPKAANGAEPAKRPTTSAKRQAFDSLEKWLGRKPEATDWFALLDAVGVPTEKQDKFNDEGKLLEAKAFCVKNKGKDFEEAVAEAAEARKNES